MDAIVSCVWNVDTPRVVGGVWGVVWTRVFLRDTASDTKYKRKSWQGTTIQRAEQEGNGEGGTDRRLSIGRERGNKRRQWGTGLRNVPKPQSLPSARVAAP